MPKRTPPTIARSNEKNVNLIVNNIDYIIEDNEMKHGKLLPGVRIPIQGKNGQLDENPPDNVLVLAWNFFDYIKKNNQELVNRGCEFITLKD